MNEMMDVQAEDIAPNPDWAELGFVPGKVFRCFGMRRAGNHAMINWMLRNAPPGHVFLNNCTPRRSPYRTCATIEVNGERRTRRRRRAVSSITGDVQDGGLLMISYEDHMPPALDARPDVTTDMPRDAVTQDILLYRRFINWSASLMRKLQSNENFDFSDRMRVATIALSKFRTGLAQILAPTEHNILPVSYDSWLRSDSYRKGVLRMLDLPLLDDTLGEVQPYGGGSSFQKDATSAEELGTSERWAEMIGMADYQLILLMVSQDPTFMDLLERAMPHDAATVCEFVSQARFPFDVKVGDGT